MFLDTDGEMPNKEPGGDEEKLETFRLDEYKPPIHRIDRAKLVFKIIDDTRVDIEATLQVEVNPDRALEADETVTKLNLDKVKDMEVVSISIDGETLDPGKYEITDSKVLLTVPEGNFELKVVSRVNPKENDSGEGVYISSGLIVTQCEAIGFRRIVPTIDRPDVMPLWTTTVSGTKERCPVLLSNGNTIDSSDDGDRHSKTFENPFRMASYLFAMIAGDLGKIEDEVERETGVPVKIEIYAAPGKQEDSKIGMVALKMSMQWEKDEFGIECDLDEYDVVIVDDFNAGAMENKGLNVFSASNALGTPRTRTDAALMGIYGTYYHEYGHNVHGNRTGVRDWCQIALKEGVTRWKDQKFTEFLIGQAIGRIQAIRYLRAKQFLEDAGPTAHPVLQKEYKGDPSTSMYTPTAYNKGAEVINMMYILLGEEKFKAGMALYLEKFDGKSGTIHDYIDAMAEAGEYDFEQFKNWVDQIGTPVCKVTTEYDEETETLRMNVAQECTKKPKLPLHFPMVMGLIGEDGKEIALELEGDTSLHDLERGILNITEPEETFVFKNVPKGAVPSLFRGFSAPVKLEYEYDLKGIIQLVDHDKNGFDRYNACERLSRGCIKQMVAAYQKGSPLEVPEEALEAYGRVLAQAEENPGLTAEILTMPPLIGVVQDMDTYDFEAANAARRALKKAIAERHEAELLRIYEVLNADKSFGYNEGEIDIPVMQKRAMKNLALDYLLELDDRHIELARTQFEESETMSDKQTAFRLLCERPADRERVAREFYDEWKDNKLLMRDWLRLQSRIDSDDFLETVKGLKEHEMFDIKKQSLVYSLIALGMTANYAQFHKLTGEGTEATSAVYEFVADMAVEIPNESVACRLLRESFSMLPKMDEHRQRLMREQLERVEAECAGKDKKKNVIEQVRKILGEA